MSSHVTLVLPGCGKSDHILASSVPHQQGHPGTLHTGQEHQLAAGREQGKLMKGTEKSKRPIFWVSQKSGMLDFRYFAI